MRGMPLLYLSMPEKSQFNKFFGKYMLLYEEKEKITQGLLNKFANDAVTITIIKNKTFDEIKQNFFGKKILTEYIRNMK